MKRNLCLSYKFHCCTFYQPPPPPPTPYLWPIQMIFLWHRYPFHFIRFRLEKISRRFHIGCRQLSLYLYYLRQWSSLILHFVSKDRAGTFPPFWPKYQFQRYYDGLLILRATSHPTCIHPLVTLITACHLYIGSATTLSACEYRCCKFQEQFNLHRKCNT